MSVLGAGLDTVAPRLAVTWRLFRRLESPRARGIFLRRELDRRLLRRHERLPPLGPDCRVLFVCHGNIMRSALAEVALRAAIGADRAHVTSAGTAAIVDNPADPRAIAYARQAGLDLGAHRATLFDADLGRRASLIFALDRRIEAEVVALDPALASRTLLLAGVSESGRYVGADVDDPYLLNEGSTARSFDLVLESVRVLAGVLLKSPRT